MIHRELLPLSVFFREETGAIQLSEFQPLAFIQSRLDPVRRRPGMYIIAYLTFGTNADASGFREEAIVGDFLFTGKSLKGVCWTGEGAFESAPDGNLSEELTGVASGFFSNR